MTPNPGLPIVRTVKAKGDHEITEPALRRLLADKRVDLPERRKGGWR